MENRLIFMLKSVNLCVKISGKSYKFSLVFIYLFKYINNIYSLRFH